MKRFEFDIAPSVIRLFFPKERIKSKLQVLLILLEATRYMLTYSNLKKTDSKGKLILIVDKMSRLFFHTDNKLYSIAFPFIVNELEEKDENGNKFFFTFKNNIVVSSYLISSAISVLKCNSFMENCSLDFVDYSFVNFYYSKKDMFVMIMILKVMKKQKRKVKSIYIL